jgi:hypothetical protein
MTLDDLGNIGEFVGAIGVILSLVFVGLQLRKNTEALNDANTETASSRVIELSQLLASDAELARLWSTGLKTIDDLDPVELTRFSSLMYSTITDIWDQFAKHRKGQIDERTWLPVQENLRFFISQPGFRQWLAINPMALPGEFKAWLEVELAELEAGATGK